MAVNVHEAKTHLSRLLDRAAAGEEVVISKYGKPVARLVAVGKPSGPRKLGVLKGRIRIAGGFDAPLPKALLTGFRGGA